MANCTKKFLQKITDQKILPKMLQKASYLKILKGCSVYWSIPRKEKKDAPPPRKKFPKNIGNT